MTYRRQGKSRAYLHNALGQRVFKSEPQVTQAKPDADELGGDFFHWLQSSFGWLFARNRQPSLLGQSYMYGDGQLGSYNLLGEYGNGGSKSNGRVEYLWLPTETGSAQLIGLYRNHRFYAVHTDHLGTPRLITDDDNKPVWQWSYSAFGDNQPTGILKVTTHPRQAVTNVPQMLKATNPAITLNLRFAGQYWDEESKLSYNYFRSYQSSQGRYTQSDPIGLAGGWNTYSYVTGNPLSGVDPKGLQTYTCTRPLKGLGGVRWDDVNLFHEYVCTRDAKTGLMTCGGIGPSGSMRGSPSVLEPDDFKPESCEKRADKNSCVESCVQKRMSSQLPTYDVFAGTKLGKPGTQQCQIFAEDTVSSCISSCLHNFD